MIRLGLVCVLALLCSCAEREQEDCVRRMIAHGVSAGDAIPYCQQIWRCRK